MKALYYNLLHKIAGFCARTLGKIHAPWTRKNIHYTDVAKVLEILLPGDYILARTNGEFSTIMIPGFYKHAAIYIGDGKIIDATSVGVTERYLADLMMDTDNVAIMRVPNLTKDQQSLIVSYCKYSIGTPYDFEVYVESRTSLYCSELVYVSINYALQCNYIELRESMGIPTVTPDDLYLMTKKANLIWEKRV